MNRVTFSKALGIVFLAASVFILGASLITGPSISTITGILILIISIMYLMNPAALYDDEKIEVKNLYGMTLKTYHFNKDEISVRDNKVFANGKKIKLATGMLVQSEYQALLEHVKSHTSKGGVESSPSKKDDQEDLLDSGL